MILAPRLVEIVTASAPRHSVADVAPSTRAELGAASAAPLVVWSGASDGTIFGDPRVNWAFRAWHDAYHLRHGFDFSPAAEVEVARLQAAAAARLGGDKIGDIVWLEVAGQALYFDSTGKFPADQLAWMHRQLVTRGIKP